MYEEGTPSPSKDNKRSSLGFTQSFRRSEEYKLQAGPKPDHYSSYEKGSFTTKKASVHLESLP